MSKAMPMPATSDRPSKYEDWRVDDAMHTMLRAREVVADKKMMGLVKKRAAERATEMEGLARQATQLAKRGLVSDKQMAKIGKKRQDSGNLAKMAPIA